jgi:flavin reductase (DIM6/NTAB) family NADH-FMN oxidoreductase RutF
MTITQNNPQTTSDHDVIGAVIGRIPSGVFIVTAREANRNVGLLASWVQQVGFEPPSVCIAIHPDREIYDAIEKSGGFVINVMSDKNTHLMKKFSHYSPEQFDGLGVQEDPAGIILTETVAALSCCLLQKVPVADHHLFIGEVVRGIYLHPDAAPMTHLRPSGFNY